MPRRRWKGFDHRILAVASIVLVSACVVYMNQKDSLAEYLGEKTVVLLDFAVGVVMLVNTRMRELFGRGQYREDNE